jgi:hypothetical protein
MKQFLEAAFRTSLVVFLAAVAAGCGSSSSPTPAPSNGCTSGSATTQLMLTNASATAVPVMITLGTTRNPASDYGVNSIGQLPASWGTYPQPPATPGGPVIQSIFLLGAGESTCFNSGALSFAGNVAFGPTFNLRGCGGDATSCYPDAATFFEFALNLGASGQETVDISGVNGTNAVGVWNLDPTPVWTNTLTTASVTQIQNAPIGSWTSPANGVYGWQSTDCVDVVQPIPNPISGCPAPLHWPSLVPQNQAQRVCNVSRASGAAGGNAQIVFNGYAAGSAPGAACVGGYTQFLPLNGPASGGTQVTMTGYGLDTVTGVTFQGQAATIVGTPTSTQLTVRTPAFPYCPGTGPQNVVVVFTVSGVPGTVTPAYPANTYTYNCP